ncbi:MAG: HD domain-containing phosphohydrolase [Desulfobacteraceae bacterium]|jgi:response regulator RpfG family c-di-GMP phosphodiesterase
MRENDQSTAKVFSVAQLSVKDAIQFLSGFAQAINPKLGQHMMLVAKLARQVGEEMKLEASYVDQLEIAGMIHDIGLLGLPKELQDKEANLLTEKQYLLYCEHPITASIAIEGVEVLSLVGEMVLYHHEYMNGKGFPTGLSGDQIPLASRILLAVSDYCRILSTWPRDIRRLVNHARRHLGSEEWKRFTFSDDPESIIEASAERLLLRNDEGKYDSGVVKSLIRVIYKKKNIDPADMVDLDELKAGMVLMDGLHMDGGRLLISKGTKLVDASIQTLQAFGERGLIPRKIYVAIPDQT